MTDPSGNDPSLTSLIISTAIRTGIGALAGGTIGGIDAKLRGDDVLVGVLEGGLSGGTIGAAAPLAFVGRFGTLAFSYFTAQGVYGAYEAFSEGEILLGAFRAIVVTVPAASKAKMKSRQLARDKNVNSQAPRDLPTARPISRSETQNAALQKLIGELKAKGASKIRVDQQQVDSSGVRVGVNRPDLQYELNGKRYYVEFDRASSGRGRPHALRLLSNDPDGEVHLITLD